MKKLFTLILGLCVAAAVAYAVPKDVGKAPIKPIIEKVFQHAFPAADVPMGVVVSVRKSDYWRIAYSAKDQADAGLRIGESPGVWIANDRINTVICRRYPEEYLSPGRSWRRIADRFQTRHEETKASLVRRC